jgi:hypothetical protein
MNGTLLIKDIKLSIYTVITLLNTTTCIIDFIFTPALPVWRLEEWLEVVTKTKEQTI